jgi:AraC-like DNA-binding protein
METFTVHEIAALLDADPDFVTRMIDITRRNAIGNEMYTVSELASMFGCSEERIERHISKLFYGCTKLNSEQIDILSEDMRASAAKVRELR